MTTQPAKGCQSGPVLPSVPDGTLATARAAVHRGLTAAGLTPSSHPLGPDQAVLDELWAPLRLDPDWPPPSPPLPVGRGAVHADLIDEDHDTLARLRALFDDDNPPGPETLATQAQQWRLPVTPYRAPSEWWPTGATGVSHAAPESSDQQVPTAEGATGRRYHQRNDTPVVVDLTALWAGPLATKLLAELGADVIKIDSDVRPDGLRAHEAVYHHLNGAKTIEDLDLRTDAGRSRFEAHLETADLVIDSFSRRVMPNLGYGPEQLAARFPHLVSISIVAFPQSMAEADWLSYGPGVHAMSGLGYRGPDRTPVAAPIAYPDALAGFEAFAVAASLMSSPRANGRAEISLAEAVGPLVARRCAGGES